MLSSSPSVPLPTSHHEANLLLEEAGDVVFRLNLMGQILFASQRAANLLRNGQELEGQSLLALICELDHAALKAALSEAIQARGAHRAEVRLKTPSTKPGSNCASAATPPATRRLNCWWLGVT